MNAWTDVQEERKKNRKKEQKTEGKKEKQKKCTAKMIPLLFMYHT